MAESVPGQDVVLPEVARSLPPAVFNEPVLARYRALLARLARPYASNSASRPAPASYPSNTLDAASGLVTTVRDLARLDAALGDLVLLEPETLEAMWTPPTPALAPGQPPAQGIVPPLPHALGWFVQTYQGERVVWQFGHWPGVTSSLIVKVPSQTLTFILLANSDGLAASSQLESGDVTTSLFARLFLRFFL
jgi:CubicO group peptidase (beta-lactamase class C family)